MTDAKQPENPGDVEPGEDPQPVVPVTGADALYTAALSGMIRNLQRSLAPALRVRIPAIPASAFRMPPIRLPQVQIPAIAALQQDIYRQVAASLEPVLRAQREQIAKVMAGVATAVQRMYPENWHGVTGLEFERLESILLDEGIPLVGVPRRTTVQAVLDAPDAAARRAVVGRRWRSILTDCEAALGSFQRRELRGQIPFAEKAIRALRDGHPEAAQALAANLLDTVLRTHFTADFRTITNNRPNGSRLDLDDYTVRVACAIAPVWAAYRQFWTSNGDPVPRTFARHASAHAVSRAQYNRTNAVLGIMLVTSLLWLCEHETPE
ncbi:hypothetical protein ACFYUR_16830 [Micromonospora haikouensis]|uniref:hypothetical protein n=1 Tax=Micromonospora haikouensis TaxID=686309 RepID=UPI00367C88A7